MADHVYFSTNPAAHAFAVPKSMIIANLKPHTERWTDILTLGPQYLEIISWNDYGESHYIGPLNSPHLDDGNSKWTNDMPHDGFLEMAKPYIAAFKAGSKTVDNFIETDQLFYWYRPSLKSAECDSTDNCQGKPDGYDTMEDVVFIVALLKSSGTVNVTSGSNTQSFNPQAGASSFQVSMGAGKQSFALIRNGQTVVGDDSLKDISEDCICGIYNFNAYVGSLPAGPAAPLQSDGLKNFGLGLKDTTCQATPSLGTASGVGIANVVAQSTTTTPTTSTASSIPIATATSSTTPNQVSTQIPSTSTPQILIASPQPTVSTTISASGSGSKTITALSQLAPTNCMHAGDVWAGPPGSDPAAFCDAG